MYDRTRALIESEKSKFIFTGQHSTNPNTKLYHFALSNKADAQKLLFMFMMDNIEIDSVTEIATDHNRDRTTRKLDPDTFLALENRMKNESAASYERDLDPNKKIVVKGNKGMNSKPFIKKFRNMKAADKWMDDNEDDIVINDYTDIKAISEAYVSMLQEAKKRPVKFDGHTYSDYKVFNSDKEANDFMEKNDDYGVIGVKGGKVYLAKMTNEQTSYERDLDPNKKKEFFNYVDKN